VEFDAEEAAIGAILKAVADYQTLTPDVRERDQRNAGSGGPRSPFGATDMQRSAFSFELVRATPATRVHRHLHRWAPQSRRR